MRPTLDPRLSTLDPRLSTLDPRLSTLDAERVALIALAEDGDCDVTSEVAIAASERGTAVIEFQDHGVLAGTVYTDAVARACGCEISWRRGDGMLVTAGGAVGIVSGALAHILRAERPMLNLLQRASGIATATRAFVNVVADTRCRVLHTRKTAPGLRWLDIGAVVAGGGFPHRTGLSREVMIKDNHWRGMSRRGISLAAALDAARARGVTAAHVEVESPAQVEAACAARATRILVDNQSPGTVRAWAELARRLRPEIEIEATGGITLVNARAYAEADVDFISVGALTHSVQAADIALEIRET